MAISDRLSWVEDSGAIRMRTYAKLNLFLRVLGRREDGFHELETIFHAVDLGDDVETSPAPPGELAIDMRLEDGLTGLLPSVEDNVITRAVICLRAKSGDARGAAIRVIKRIPIAAGLGGGSTNAAGVLVGLNELWKVGLEQTELADIALEVGSDVPYCLAGGTALATARGEKLTALPTLRSMWFVLGVSGAPLLTRDVYDLYDELGEEGTAHSAPMAMALGAGDVTAVGALLHNDLEHAAFKMRPELQADKQRLLDAGALGACMSGSGPTIFALAAGERHARELAAAVESHFAAVLVVESRPHAVLRLN
jgi:4-diphosphocytidyl-2-C-methyl-D-erythritol kinase